ncbi:AAA family ATPase [Riemerella anatipestifer]|uniref:UvrD-helicase domain-containing protein n=1 Tax=Riemerella anatipestifer TaxID=34085 RepID=UPI002861F7BC|nr:UvrD-helicase domain-containing protein [Riemerella anatipestifer]MDR7795594.1 AAA family ATPase [Riemerella anatipestifer]
MHNELKYNIDLLGRDSLNEFDLKALLKNRYLIAEKPSYFFTDNIYNSFKRFLKPPVHLKEQGKDFYFSEEQRKIIYDNSEIKSKLIKGVVGSGKTTVLASRAVQLYKKTKGKILILTYNITLKNFIHDKISMVREEFPWDAFVILNYHSFITAELNNLGVPITVPEGFSDLSEDEKEKYFEDTYYSNKSIFEENRNQIKPYDVILIDEIQDYKRSWMEIVKDYPLCIMK